VGGAQDVEQIGDPVDAGKRIRNVTVRNPVPMSQGEASFLRLKVATL
jgi:hypothetical protein